MKRLTLWIMMLLFCVAAIGCAQQGGGGQVVPTATVQALEAPTEPPAAPAATNGKGKLPEGGSASEDDADGVVYDNAAYGFRFYLPPSWEKYTVVTDTWEGRALEGENSGSVAETGPKLSIRHPEWTEQNPRQDIPIMIFTYDQWDAVSAEKLSVSAAPVPPSELGRNDRYVFALPARYNFAYLPGYEEVEQILQGSPLHTTD